MARTSFDPNDKAIMLAVHTQIMRDVDTEYFDHYVVIDDCGPSVIAGFVFEHDASALAAHIAGYVVDKDGKPTES